MPAKHAHAANPLCNVFADLSLCWGSSVRVQPLLQHTSANDGLIDSVQWSWRCCKRSLNWFGLAGPRLIAANDRRYHTIRDDSELCRW
jgi:hypothetical protein